MIRDALIAVGRNPYVRVFIVLVLVVVAVLFLRRTLNVWLLSVAAFLIAYLLYPLMRWSERRFHSRLLALALFFLALVVLLGLSVLLVVGLVQQAINFSQTLPGLIERVTSQAESLPGLIRNLPLPSSLQSNLQQAYQALVTQLGTFTTELLNGLGDFVVGGGLLASVTAVLGGVLQLFALLALTVYILLSFSEVTDFLIDIAPRPYQSVVADLLAKFETAVGGYFRGQLVIAGLVGAMVGVGLGALGVPLALSLGFLAGVFNLIPYLGVIVSTLPAMLLAASLGWPQVVGVLIVVTVANQIETHLLTPLILGQSTRLHPAAIIIALLLGASLGGIWGALLAVPLAAFVKLVYEDYYLESRLYDEG